MKSTTIGMVMINDEREHVYTQNNAENTLVLNKWAEIIRKKLKNVDGSTPEVVIRSEIITSVRVAQKVGEELSKAKKSYR